MGQSVGLNDSGKLFCVWPGDALQPSWVSVKLDLQAGKLIRISHLDLRIQRLFHNFVIDRTWQSPFGGSNAGSRVRHTPEAAVNVFKEEITAELRIEDLPGEDR